MSTDKIAYEEGEDVLATVNTVNVPDGTIVNYSMLGGGLTPSDFVGGKLSGTFEINNDIGKFVIGINNDTEIEPI